MLRIEMPMNAAHQHAANADEYLAQGYLIPAAEEHYKAAEAYMAAVERSNDESAKRTLRMLYNEHCKAGKELQRKIAKLREEGKDPAERQKPLDPPQLSAGRQNMNTGFQQRASSPQLQRPINDLQNTVDESFMLLGGQRSDPGDAFNQFWNIMQGMLDNISQPVAFATAPLGLDDVTSPSVAPTLAAELKDSPTSSDTDVDEALVSRFKRKLGLSSRRGKANGSGSKPGPSKLSRQSTLEEDFDEDMLDVGDDFDLSESFCLIPSGSDLPPTTLKKENTALKAEVDMLKTRLEATERILQLRKEKDQQLRESIFMAHREAQRVMGASIAGGQWPPVDLNSLNLNVPLPTIPGLNPGREAQYTRRIKELEDEVRGLKQENEKQKAMITKFRERWEKLKESAKRKKEAKAAAQISPVHERIVEEPEAEQELDEGKG